MKYIVFLLCFFLCIFCNQLVTGDIALDNSYAIISAQQQEGTTNFNVGKQIVTAVKHWDVQLWTSYIEFDRGSLSSSQITVGYGISNKIGLLASMPIMWKFKIDTYVSRGIGDSFYAIQYIPFLSPNNVLAIQVGVKAPSGDPEAIPLLGTGSVDFMAAMAGKHVSEHYYADFVLQGIYAGHYFDVKNGSLFSYQLSLGRRYAFKHAKDYKLYLIGVLRGTYSKPFIFGGVVSDTETNFLFIGPWIVLEHKNFLFQFNFDYPFVREVGFDLPNINYRVGFVLEWVF